MLTPEQRQKLKTAGYSEAKITAFETKKFGTITSAQPAQQSNYFQRVGQAFKQGGQDVMSGVQKGAEQYQQGVQETKGTIGQQAKGQLKATGGLLRSGLRTAGAVAKTAIAPITEAPGIKQGLEKVGGTISKIPGAEVAFQKLNQFKEKHPESAKDIEDVVNLLTLGGGKVAEKPLQQGLMKAGQKTAQGVSKTGRAVKQGVGNVAKDLLPKSEAFVEESVAKALGLSPGDLATIESKTGNKVTQWIADNNLIRGNVDETKKAIDEVFSRDYKAVRDEISKVDGTYSQSQIPGFTDTMVQLRNSVKDVPGLEKSLKEIDAIFGPMKNKRVKLTEVQRTKELLDKYFSLYKNTGDVKESVTKQGLANLRTNLKGFIENEVKQKTGADIASLNRNVTTAKNISDSITKRKPKGLLKSNIQMGDLGFFGLGTFAGGPIGGAALLFAKKVWEAPSFRLKIAKIVDRMSDAKKARIKAEMQSGKIPEDFHKFIKGGTAKVQELEAKIPGNQ